MALEDRGVDKKIFMALQEEAKASIYQSSDSLEDFSQQLSKHNLGGKFHLASILEQLSKLGLDFKDGTDKKAIGGAFFECLLRFSLDHSLREVKFKARIPVPDSYQLVGVADEGQAYIKEGIADKDDVFTLGPGRIYGTFLCGFTIVLPHTRQHPVCVQKTANDPPIYLKGTCVISRSPVIHPGDGMYMSLLPSNRVVLIGLTVQRVYAVGEPPEDKICFFRGLKNVVVLPAVGAYLQSLKCATIDVSAFQASVRWHLALLEGIWMGTYMHVWEPQTLTILQRHLRYLLCKPRVESRFDPPGPNGSSRGKYQRPLDSG